jgi:hypothetical protein
MAPRERVSTENTPSTPPAAPSRWPIMDLLAVMATFFAWAPNTALTARVSHRSFR